MQQAMADCLNVEPSRFSVKATTSEKMGFIGRREGIACWAVATVVKQN
jgi:2-C-methyl-D-erythritol 2,4-cyclodiphosphate synthase